MTPSESTVPDRPFPGAHPQVPHGSGSADASTSAPSGPAWLPLDAVHERSEQGWVVRIPVRAEHVTVSKEVVISERVVLRRNWVRDVAHVEAAVQREQLRVETEGQVSMTTHPDSDVLRRDTDRLAARQGLPWRRDEHATLARAPRPADEAEEHL
jgi:hypothetical protein